MCKHHTAYRYLIYLTDYKNNFAINSRYNVPNLVNCEDR